MEPRSGQWRSLRTNHRNLPALFVKLALATQSYTIILTDLTHVWEEHLDQQGIFDRAENDGCAISPREDKHQLQILLEKIDDALLGAEGTSVSIKHDLDEGLNLRLLAPLPDPLPRLTWTAQLRKQESQALTNYVVGPLLLNLHGKQMGIEKLQSELREKDHVIARLLDRLESSGTDLTTVFPGTSNIRPSKKVSQRNQLAKYVKGLSPFELNLWTTPSENAPAPASLFDAVESSHDRHLDTLRQSLGGYPARWWSDIDIASLASDLCDSTLERPATPRVEDDEETEDEDFQVQPLPKGQISSEPPPAATVERSRRSVSTASAVTPYENGHHKSPTATASSPMLSPPSKHTTNKTTPPRTIESAAATPQRIGVIGGARDQSPPKSPSPPTPDARYKSLEPPQGSPSKRAGSARLGVIGGRKAKPAIDPAGTLLVVEEEEGKAEPILGDSVPKRRSQRKEQHNDVPSLDRGRSHASDHDPIQEQSEPRESSQDRANRRREELKRQLTSQQSGAIKKKRRF